MQDFKERAVYWFLPPVLAAALIGLKPFRNMDDCWPVIFNLNFIALLLLLSTAVCSLWKRRFINILKFWGSGDILFFTAISFYLSALNFILFFVTGSIALLFCWSLWRRVSGKIARYIPMGGFHAILLLALLSCDWFYLHFNVTEDLWLWHMIIH
ncbi:hypothetical protein [Mucilaginibacter rubeus]|uniref:Prepilin type IV endopeptidase peptidase domain-containing protein n=1 Tax=Mucilaginibacter rubeus TaxID=2027860 RepID=A0A5C1HTE5_9SPHI|nr:hypothetical protein [Mucilaginibacter rubeus]QEM09152.1 hypothetical protein DEO27_003675 [Mucilaginibacter rubeus]